MEKSELQLRKDQLHALVDKISDTDAIFLCIQDGPRDDGSRYNCIKITIERDGLILKGEPIMPIEDEDIYYTTETDDDFQDFDG